jgi:hypothetical protein
MVVTTEGEGRKGVGRYSIVVVALQSEKRGARKKEESDAVKIAH